MNTFLNILIDGLAYGMVLFVIAVGLSVTLGLMRFVNLSHGAFAMVGGYCAALLTREAQWSFWLAVPAADGREEVLVLRNLLIGFSRCLRRASVRSPFNAPPVAAASFLAAEVLG